jgi:hypothetical protein
MSQQPTEPDGTSQFGFSEAVYDALHTTYTDEAKEGTKFKVDQQWVSVEPHHSPWHITYNVTIQRVPGT